MARFLPDWQGAAPVGAGRPSLRGQAALERLAEVVDQLAGVPIPASVLERDVLPARIPGYQPRLLDELGALGEVAWVGRGSLNRDDGRIALYRPGWEILRAAAAGLGDEAARPEGRRHDAIRELLARRGATFYRELYVAAGGGPDREVLDALWDLVWTGEVTNDTFAPLRALRWRRPAKTNSRPRLGRLTALGPPEAAGRWSLVETAVREAGAPATALRTERLHALALSLLERHGVLTREAVTAEGVVGGFSSVYPVLRALEEAGRIRRGYFVDGLGAAQFALPGALDRLRAVREPAAGEPRVHLLAAADPANPFGAALAWPRRDDADRRPFQRAAGAYVVSVDGAAALYLERGGSSLQAFPAADDPAVAAAALAALRTLVTDGRVRELVVTRVDGQPIGSSPWRERLQAAGFTPGYRGLVLRSAPPARR
jgi:ATP-dependent Lhr-like helicase